MPIAASDLKKYQSANMPENDTGTSGGAVTTTGILANLVQASNTAPKAASSNAGDTMTLTITGRLASGAIDSEAIALTGTSQITFTKTFERILKAVLGSAPAGTVTIYMNDGTTSIVAIPAGKTSVRRLFYDAASEAGETFRYEKEYWRNEHGTLTLNNAVLRLTDDAGEDATHDIQIGLESSGSQSVTNRKTAPGSVSFVDENVDVSISGGLAALASVGLWVRLRLSASASAKKSTFTTELAGTTT